MNFTRHETFEIGMLQINRDRPSYRLLWRAERYPAIREFGGDDSVVLGFTMLGLGAGALIIPSVAHYLTVRFSWRLTFGIVGAAILVINVPVLTKFLKERREPMGLLPDGSAYTVTPHLKPDADPGLSWREAWGGSTFWLLFCSFILVSASVQACLTHTTAIFADRGVPAHAAALATSLFGGGLLVAGARNTAIRMISFLLKDGDTSK